MTLAYTIWLDSSFILDLIPFWPILFVVVWAVWNMARDSRDAKLLKRSLSWPETQGCVIAARVAWAHVNVDYDYFIQ